MEARQPGPLARDILTNWNEMAQTLFPEGVGAGLKSLVNGLAEQAAGSQSLEHPAAFGQNSRILYRTCPVFTAERIQADHGERFNHRSPNHVSHPNLPATTYQESRIL